MPSHLARLKEAIVAQTGEIGKPARKIDSHIFMKTQQTGDADLLVVSFDLSSVCFEAEDGDIMFLLWEEGLH